MLSEIMDLKLEEADVRKKILSQKDEILTLDHGGVKFSARQIIDGIPCTLGLKYNKVRIEQDFRFQARHILSQIFPFYSGIKHTKFNKEILKNGEMAFSYAVRQPVFARTVLYESTPFDTRSENIFNDLLGCPIHIIDWIAVLFRAENNEILYAPLPFTIISVEENDISTKYPIELDKNSQSYTIAFDVLTEMGMTTFFNCDGDREEISIS